MRAYTIDETNAITVHETRKAARATGAGVFTSEVELADLVGNDSRRLVEIFNGLPGVRPVSKFSNRKSGCERIWRAIQGLGQPPVADSELAVTETTKVEPPAEVSVPEPAIQSEAVQQKTEPVEHLAP